MIQGTCYVGGSFNPAVACLVCVRELMGRCWNSLSLFLSLTHSLSLSLPSSLSLSLSLSLSNAPTLSLDLCVRPCASVCVRGAWCVVHVLRAGISMNRCVAAMDCIISEDGVLMLDPSLAEESVRLVSLSIFMSIS